MTALDTTKGDAEFTAFMGQVAPSLLRTAWLLTGDADRAQDLAQTALARTCGAWPRARQEDGLGWARRVLVNLRVHARRTCRPQVAASGHSVSHAAVTSPGGGRSDDVVRRLQQLPVQQRRVIVLRYDTRLPEPAVADLLDIPASAVRSAASRAMARLCTGVRPPPRHVWGGRGARSDLEADIRSVLADATEPLLTIDPETILHRGHREARTRRAVRVVSSALLVLVVAATALAVGMLMSSHRTIGGPDLVRRPPVSANLLLGGREYSVVVGFDAPGSTLDFYRLAPSGQRQRLWGRSTEGLGNGAAFGNAEPGGVILGVVPSDALEVSAFFLGRPLSASYVAVTPLPDTGYQAVGVQPEDAVTASRFLGVGWVDHQGVRFTSVPSGDLVATFTLQTSGNQVSVWADPFGRDWGADVGTVVDSARTPPEVGRREVAWPALPAWVRTDPARRDAGFAYGLLPEGATDVWFTLAPGAHASGTVQTQQLPGAHLTAFALELDPPRGVAVGHQLRALSWTNPDGTRSEHTFP